MESRDSVGTVAVIGLGTMGTGIAEVVARHGFSVRAIDIECTVDFLVVSSYGNDTKSSGVVQIGSDLTTPVEGRHVILIEDIVDTGLTMSYLLKNLESRSPASVKVCTLLEKPSRLEVEVPIDYKGFTIDDHFVVGYGLDYAQTMRNLPFIGYKVG